MKISLDDHISNNRIDAYEIGLFRVNGEQYFHSLIITSDGSIDEWSPNSVIDLATQHMDQLVQLNPEIILLGTGSYQAFPAPEILEPVYDAGVGIEIMDTGAASRSFNLLAAEGRKIAAGLMLIQK